VQNVDAGIVDAKYLMTSTLQKSSRSSYQITCFQTKRKLVLNNAAIQVCWTVAKVPSNFACPTDRNAWPVHKMYFGSQKSLHMEVIAAS
jgi:hypothetical protein